MLKSRFGIVALRHMGRGALLRWALFLAFAGVLWASGPASSPLAITVSSETAPAGTWTQLKIFLNPPASVSGGNIAMDLDPAVFGDIASVAVFSPNGDALGYANVSQQHVDAHFESSSAWLGAMPNLPVFVVDVPVLSTAPAGATTSVTLDASGTSLSDAQGNPYSVSVTTGKFTVGGTLSITSITPAGGIVPAGDPFLQQSIDVTGTGLDAGATLASHLWGPGYGPIRFRVRLLASVQRRIRRIAAHDPGHSPGFRFGERTGRAHGDHCDHRTQQLGYRSGEPDHTRRGFQLAAHHGHRCERREPHRGRHLTR